MMRSYRESFPVGDGRRGLTQEALLDRMGSVDSDYAERYSHATVSRWESGVTRPTLQRLRVFGKALNLSQVEIAGLILLAGFAVDFQTAMRYVTDSGDGEAADHRTVPDRKFAFGISDRVRDSSFLAIATRFWFLRVLPLGICIIGGYVLSLYGWNNDWMPTAYVAFATSLVLAQGFLLPDRDAGIREFFWVSLFFLLTTPLLQFSPIRMDHYNFYRIGDFAGTQIPYMLALLVNLVIASTAGLMFQLLWRQHADGAWSSSPLRRAAWAILPPVFFVHTVIVVITNISVSIQLAVLLPVTGAIFTALLVLRDPELNPSERDRLYLLSTVSVAAMLSTTVGLAAILLIYSSPDLPSVLPDHNLLRSWEIDFAQLGFTRDEALDRINVGYVWHAMWVFVYTFFILGGRLIVAIYRINDRRQH